MTERACPHGVLPSLGVCGWCREIREEQARLIATDHGFPDYRPAPRDGLCLCLCSGDASEPVQRWELEFLMGGQRMTLTLRSGAEVSLWVRDEPGGSGGAVQTSSDEQRWPVGSRVRLQWRRP